MNQLRFGQFLECQVPRTNPKPPPAENQSPPIENFLATVLCKAKYELRLLTWKIWNWGRLLQLPHLATRLVATVF